MRGVVGGQCILLNEGSQFEMAAGSVIPSV